MKVDPFEYLRRHLPQLNTTSGLMHCALSVSLHALDDVEIEHIEQRFNELEQTIRARCVSASPSAMLAHAHEVLFVEESFNGCEGNNYYNPSNSYLPIVLESRRGIPITICLVYKIVLDRLGLQVRGIQSVGHFLVRVHDGEGWIIVDPYRNGRMYAPDEAEGFIKSQAGSLVGENDDVLPDCDHVDWLLRIVRNLIYIFHEQGNEHDLAAMLKIEAIIREFYPGRG